MRPIAIATAALVSLANAFPSQDQAPLHQQPLSSPINPESSTSLLIHELRKADIIPTLIDTFEPLLTLSIFWTNATAEVGNTLPPSRLQKAPDLQFINHVPPISLPSSSSTTKPGLNSSIQLTVALTDPDAPSRDDPKWSQVCHWIATNVQLTELGDGLGVGGAGFSEDVDEVMEYKPPGPPPKTGKHRYVFVALAPVNRTMERLNLRKPEGRKRWGGKKVRGGVREWAVEHGLEVVGANFIYAQNEKQ